MEEKVSPIIMQEVIKKDQAQMGFEGMNYEQKRKPYGEGTSLESDRNRNPGSETSLGKRRDDL